jgi:hypothetical protein
MVIAKKSLLVLSAKNELSMTMQMIMQSLRLSKVTCHRDPRAITITARP